MRLAQAHLAAAVCVALAATAQAQFAGVDVRNDPAVDAAASSLIGQDVRVFRLFAAYESQAEVTVVGQLADKTGFGIASAFMDIGAGFFQVPEGGDTPPIAGLFGALPELQYDSFVSVNRFDSSGGDTTTTDPDFGFMDVGGPPSEDFIAGGWFVLPNLTEPGQGLSEFNPSTGRYEVFLAQLTVTNLPDGLAFGEGPSSNVVSIFDGELTIFNALGPGQLEANTVQFSPTDIPAPAAALCLAIGCAGALRRRR